MDAGGTTPTPPPQEATAAEQPGATSTAAGTGDTSSTFANPVLRGDFADPFVRKEGDTYYAYATNASGRNIQVATSPDLVKWTQLTDAMPALPSWAKLGGSLVWAPEVIKLGDKFVLYYTARDKASNKQCVGVATSDKPEGKFRDTHPAPLVCQVEEGGTIDSSPYHDGDKLYLYYKNDGNCCGLATYLYVQELAPDGLSLVGEPARLVRNDKAWEGRVVEAPTMWKQDGKYYLFFSANNYAGLEYSVGYANCETPTGPCEDAPENPILKSRMTRKPLVIGPGHQSIIVDDDGGPWLVYHVWDVTSAGLRGDSRFMWIDRLAFEGGKPVVKGPTTDPQPVP
jgi:beta-xylosidase